MDQRDRMLVLDALRGHEDDLAHIATWLDTEGHERAAILVQEAWRDLLAAQTLLDRDPGAVRGLVNKLPGQNGHHHAV